MDKSIYLYDNNLKLCHIFSSQEGNNRYYNSSYTSDLATGAETLNITTPVDISYSESLVEGSYLGFFWKDKFKLMQIKYCRDIEQIRGCHRELRSEFVGIGLLNNHVRPFSMVSNMTTLLNFMLINTNYKVGYVSPTLDAMTVQTEVTDTTPVYSVLQNIIENFGGCEWEFEVKVINEVRGEFEFLVNCYGQGERGTPTYKRFEYDFNTYGTEREGDITEFCAGLIGVGANGITFKDCEWFEAEGDPMDKPLGDDFLLDMEVHEKFNNGGTPILGVYKSDAITPIDLLWETYRKLQEVNKTKFKYKVPVFMTDIEYENVDVGDTVHIINDKFDPPIQLEGRIGSLSVSFTEDRSSCELTNYREVKSKIKNVDRNSIIKDAVNEMTGFNGKLTQADLDSIERFLETLDMQESTIDTHIKELEDNVEPDIEVPVVDVPEVIPPDKEDYTKIFVKTTDGGLWIGGSRVHDIIKYGCAVGTVDTPKNTEYTQALAYYKKFSLGTKADTAAMNSLTSSSNKYKLSTIVKYWAGKFGLDPYLVFAIIMAESGGNPYASGAAYGIMQCQKASYFGIKQTVKFLDGTTKSFTPSLSTMKPGGKVTLNGVSVDKGISNQIMFGCHKFREALIRFKYNVFASLMGYNFGFYGADWVICKYVADKNNLSFKNSRGYTYQSTKVQALYFKELETMQASWSNLRKTYVSTFKAGTATNIEYYLRWYKSVNGQLPYVIDNNGVRRGYGASAPVTVTKTTTTTTNTTTKAGIATSKRNIIVAKAKELVNLHVKEKKATYDQKNRISNDAKRFKAKGTIYGIKNPYCYDCSSLVSCAYLDAGFDSVYNKSCGAGTLVKSATSKSGWSAWKCDSAGVSKAVAGDILMVSKSTINASKVAENPNYYTTYHTLIYIGNGQVAHASKWAYHPGAMKISNISYYQNLGTAFFLRPWDLAKADKAATTTTTTTTSKPDNNPVVATYDSVFKGVPGMCATDIVNNDTLISNITVGDISNTFAYPKSINYAFVDFDVNNLSETETQATINLLKTLNKKYPKVPIFIAKQMKVNSNYADYVNTNTLIDNYNAEMLAFANVTQYIMQIDISSGLVANGMINTTLSTNGYSFKDKVATTTYYNSCKKAISTKPVALAPATPQATSITVTLASQKTYSYKTALASLDFKLPSVVPNDYYTRLVFSTRKNSEPTKFTQSNIVYLEGTDCKKGALIPKADTTYTITIFKNVDTEVTTKKYFGYVNGISKGGKYKDFATFKGAASLVSIAKSYYTNRSKFIYNNTTPADFTNPSANTSKWITNGKMHIDDSSFLNYCMMGLAFKDSPYGKNTLTANKKNTKYSWTMSSTRNEANIGKYFVQQGWILEGADVVNFSNVEAGDVLFMDPSGTTDNDEFMGINHIAIVAGPTDGIMQVIECANTASIIKYAPISDYKAKNVLFVGRIRKD